MKRIWQAIEKDAYVHLLTASALIPYERRKEAVDRLVGALGTRRTRDWAVFACLQYLTGVELGRDNDAWRAWWPRHRDDFFSPKAPRDRIPRKGVPTFD